MAGVLLLLFMGAADTPPAAAEYAEFSLRGFTAVASDNGVLGEHRNCYNGLYRLDAPGKTESPFVPLYAGLNLEHYFDARPRPEDRQVFFEPRWAPMKFAKIDDRTAELYQPETPVYGVESRTRFVFSEPHYVDMEFTCTPHKPMQGGFVGCFWASYINAPEDKSVYFLASGSTLDSPRWVQFCTQQHDRDSSVLWEKDALPVAFEPGGTTLYNCISPLRYSEPFFYGRWRDMALIYIFERGAPIRFAHSPSGGGSTPDGKDTNPAWDFQFFAPDAQAGKEYGFKMRLVYKPWAGRDDVLEEVRRYWRQSRAAKP